MVPPLVVRKLIKCEERPYLGSHTILRFKGVEWKMTNLNPRGCQDELSCQTNSQDLTIGTVYLAMDIVPVLLSHKDHINNDNTSLAAKGALAHRLHRRTACKIQNGRQGGGAKIAARVWKGIYP